MICPNCKKLTDVGQQMVEWDKEYGDQVGSQAMINIILNRGRL